jgi:hypothetical protein
LNFESNGRIYYNRGDFESSVINLFVNMNKLTVVNWWNNPKNNWDIPEISGNVTDFTRKTLNRVFLVWSNQYNNLDELVDRLESMFKNGMRKFEIYWIEKPNKAKQIHTELKKRGFEFDLNYNGNTKVFDLVLKFKIIK